MEGTIEEELEGSGAWFALRHPWWILIHKYYQRGFLDKFEALVCMNFILLWKGRIIPRHQFASIFTNLNLINWRKYKFYRVKCYSYMNF